MQNNYDSPGNQKDRGGGYTAGGCEDQRGRGGYEDYNAGSPEGIERSRADEAGRGRCDTEYAGFWVRLAAYCIDLAIVWTGLLFVKLVMGIMSLTGAGVFQTQLLFHYTLRDIILYVLQVVYFILLTYYTGTTLGKRLMNLRVINADGRERLEFVNVVYRETVGRFLCGLSVGIGYIMAGVDREKRGLHDMLCDTRVIYGKKIKVFPKYQVLNYYPPIPPMPPAPPYGMPPWEGMPGRGPGPMDPPPADGRLPQEGTPGKGPGPTDPPPADGRLPQEGTPGKGTGTLPPYGRTNPGDAVNEGSGLAQPDDRMD